MRCWEWELRSCKTCGGAPWPGTDQCANCWEVERRLEEYLKSANGLDFVITELEKLGYRLVQSE